MPLPYQVIDLHQLQINPCQRNKFDLLLKLFTSAKLFLIKYCKFNKMGRGVAATTLRQWQRKKKNLKGA